MAVADTINSIKTHIQDAYGVAEEKGATIPTNKNLENLADTIGSISGGGVEPFITDCQYLISYNRGLQVDKIMKLISIQNVTSCSYMFNYAKLSTNVIDLSIFPSNISYNYLFYRSNLINSDDFLEVKLPNNTYNLSYTFSNAYLKKIKPCIDVNLTNNFNNSYFNYFASTTSSLESIDFSNFNLNLYVTNANSYFGCTRCFYLTSNLTELDLTTWNINLTNNSYFVLNEMFSSSSVIERIVMPNFVGLISDMSQCFNSCKKLKYIDISGLDFTRSSVILTNTFSGCTELETVLVKDQIAKDKIDTALANAGLSITSTIKE